MAEYIFRARMPAAAGWNAASAGLAAAAGCPATDQGVRALADWGIDAHPHRARQVTRDLLERSDRIVVMTESHRQHLVAVFPEFRERVSTLKSFGVGHRNVDVADPIGGSYAVYCKTRDEIAGAVSDLMLQLVEEQKRPAEAVNERSETMTIALGADHGGYEHKEAIKRLLTERGLRVEDIGAHNKDSVDYPDFGGEVARRVSEGLVDQGVLVCTTGVGMAITANRFPRVRAALVTDARVAALAREHNDANVLVLGASVTPIEDLPGIVDAWLSAGFAGGRHERRVNKMEALAVREGSALAETDREIHDAVQAEIGRQRDNLELIASENYVSRAVREAQGSVLTNKYAEGYPGKRWYNGCEFVDRAEQLAIDRAKALFGAEHVNVQPHSGSGANMTVYFAMLQPGDKILAMSLAHGGHLTHGHKMNFSGRFFEVIPYGVDRENERIDYDEVRRLADEHKPRLICAGASAYPRTIDFERLRAIADAVGAMLMVDMAHIAGLVAAGEHPSPVPYCDFVTTTTHKTLRGPRGGMVLCREAYAAEIDKQVFPGIQGGPLMHVIAAKAVCFQEALQPAFKQYARQVVENAGALAMALTQRGLRIVSGGTDNHLMLVDLTPIGVTGKDAATALDKASITVNKNAIPFDTKSPFVTSGIRIGTPAVTTRGMGGAEMDVIAECIERVLKQPGDEAVLGDVRARVHALTARFPVP